MADKGGGRQARRLRYFGGVQSRVLADGQRARQRRIGGGSQTASRGEINAKQGLSRLIKVNQGWSDKVLNINVRFF
jgi:hypothetical protein